MSKKRKAFKTSPSVRIPRAAVQKLQHSKVQAVVIASLEKAIAGHTHDMVIFIRALRDAVKYIDRFRNSEGSWTVADVKRLEEIRLLSIGV